MNKPKMNFAKDETKASGRRSLERDVSRRGFLTAPTAEQLAPTARERALLKQLWDWQEASKHSTIILGVPSAHANDKVSYHADSERGAHGKDTNDK